MKDELYYVKNAPMHEVPEEGERPAPWRDTHVIGMERPRVDAFERLTGAAVYPSDVVRPNMLYAAIVRCPHAHAKVRSVDTSAAEKMKGVHAVITGKTKEAQLKWPYAKDYERPLFDPEPKFEGEAVAAVAAETPDRAWDAVRAIKVDYEVLPALSDERKALESGAPKVHKDGNKIKTENYSRGDVEAGFSEADEVMEENYRTACELHTPIELHGCVAEWDGNRLALWESTQGVYAVQETVARVMDMPRSQVRVIGHYVGGGFGSKLDTGKYSVIAAILARKTGRPVKAFLT
ncbi:MAG: xanthine dehydrogenase family protein molybdopterin-binding subunit, partial [Desulfococcaceae bacterium]